jgi:small subunit ribosomal protein S4
MGDPRRLRKKYSKPGHPFEKDRIEEENKLIQEYGLKNKKEIWKAESSVRKYRAQARKIQADKTKNREKKEKELMDKLKKMGLITEGGLDEVLALKVNNLLDRRLQTFVFKKGLAKSPKQARQFIVHGHISVNGKKVDIPGHTVTVKQEAQIDYYGHAPPLEPLKPEPKPEEESGEPVKVPETKPHVPAHVPETKPSIPQKGGDSE